MSGGVGRLWRPAAQRQVRNAWAALHAQRAAWAAASAAAVTAASSLVNVFLSHRYMGSMDLGVLQDMEGICNKAQAKLRRQQKAYLEQLLSGYGDLVKAVCIMMQATKSMRTYMKGSGEGPLIEFSNEPSVQGDAGDGAGVPVFATLPLDAFELLADEVVAMFEAELKVKWLLASEFHSIVFPKAPMYSRGEQPNGDDPVTRPTEVVAEGRAGGTGLPTGWPNPLAKSGFFELDWSEVEDISRKRSKGEVQRETLQVYLTTLLSEVNIDKQRIEGIVAMVNDEMNLASSSSPIRSLMTL